MKKTLVAVLALSMLTVAGCGNSSESKKTSESTKTEAQFEKESKKREEDAKRKQELVQEVSILKESVASMEKLQKQAEKMATENTMEDMQASYDEGVTLGKQGLEDLKAQLKDSEAELEALK
ncbi:hypothetical protein [Enterococcus crotali]|uniref:hypothetical protein n=1 Tax=Enterococcus crotali TaxID=1453587 RepID=UPI00046FEBE9|nr:hypothetical protein [Enterococcus crotali]OTP47788.1 hypothetical protein A5881_002910 [Enterococcus termitis]